MKFLKKLVKKYFKHFAYFYTHLRYRIFVALSMSLLVGVLDGFGLAMFLPLLQMADGQSGSNYEAEGMGNLSFLISGMSHIGLPFSLASILIVMLCFFLMKGIFKFSEGYIRVINERYFIKRLRFFNIDLLANYAYKSFVLSDAGRIQNTFSGEVDRVVTAYRSYFNAIQYGILVIVYVVLALMANAQFAILVAVGGLLTNFLYKNIYKTTKALSRQLTKENHAFQGLLMQKIIFFKYLKATGLLSLYGKKLKLNILEIEKHGKKIGLYSSALQAVREPVVVAVVIAVILLQVNVVGERLGLIILSLLFFYRSLSFLMSVQNHWNTFLGVTGSLDNMTNFSKELKKGADRQGVQIFKGLKDGILLRNVSFSYGTTSILKDISFEIKKNETVAIVGESGSGKTLLMNLISGLMLPDAGDIFIDDTSTQALDRNSFQRRIGYITQDAVIFNDTVYNNVTFWASPTEQNLGKFYEVLKQAAIYDFVMELPEREQSYLGNNGITVSGGQKQRLSIARELFKEVDFLFLDEATSALDSETERSVQQNIDDLKGQYTIVIVAHRLSTIKNADRVVLLNKGKIESIGDFEYLKNHSSTFEKMVELQEV